jgi:hypothetical protein
MYETSGYHSGKYKDQSLLHHQGVGGSMHLWKFGLLRDYTVIPLKALIFRKCISCKVQHFIWWWWHQQKITAFLFGTVEEVTLLQATMKTSLKILLLCNYSSRVFTYIILQFIYFQMCTFHCVTQWSHTQPDKVRNVKCS